MIKVLFVCLGNICRSPMAEFVFRNMVQKRGMQGKITCASAATSHEEEGNPVYPPARAKLKKLGLDPTGKRATPLTKSDYDEYDLIIGMEKYNISAMLRIFGGDPAGKIHLLMDYTGRGGDIADPWYTGDFDTALAQITQGCQALLGALTSRPG